MRLWAAWLALSGSSSTTRSLVRGRPAGFHIASSELLPRRPCSFGCRLALYSCVPESEGEDDTRIPKIRDVTELGDVAKRQDGVYHLDSEVLEAWQDSLGNRSDEGDSQAQRVALSMSNIQDENGASCSDDDLYKYAKSRLENDASLQGDMDLEKAEEARAIILEKLLGASGDGALRGYSSSSDAQPNEEEDAGPSRRRPEPTEEQIARRKEIMRDIAEGMKQLNLRKEE